MPLQPHAHSFLLNLRGETICEAPACSTTKDSDGIDPGESFSSGIHARHERMGDRLFQSQGRSVGEKQGHSPNDDRARVSLESILAKWAVVEQGNFGRLVDLGAADPPTYNPDGDAEESAEVGQGVIQLVWVQRDGLHNRFRFTMKPFAGRWKIQKKELLNFKGKWQRSVL